MIGETKNPPKPDELKTTKFPSIWSLCVLQLAGKSQPVGHHSPVCVDQEGDGGVMHNDFKAGEW